MLGKGGGHVLGLAIGEKSIHIAEVHAAGGVRGSGRVVRCARFDLPADAGWDKPNELGPRLGAFLDQQRFGARRALVGFPGRWVLVKPRPVPPVAPAAAVGILRLAVEREYQGDAREWAFDFAGEASAKEKTTVLLAATPQQRLTQVLGALKLAGLRVTGVTSTTLVLAMAKPASAAPGGAVLHLSAEGAELAVRSAGRVIAVERLTTPMARPADSAAPAMAGEIRRAMALAQPGVSGASRGGAGGPTLTIWDSTDADPQALARLGEGSGLAARVNPELHELGVLNGTPEVDHCMPGAAAAIALGSAALRGGRPAIDFLNSRLTVRADSRFTRPRVMAIVAGVLVLAGLIGLVSYWYSEKTEVDTLQTTLDGMKGDLKIARANLDHMRQARRWFDNRAPVLDCLRELTMVFSSSGRAWSTSVALRDDDNSNDLAGTLQGKAQSPRDIQTLYDRLRVAKGFTNVKIGPSRVADRNSQVMSFEISFVYSGPK